MTIASEITRLQNDKAAICTAIENKGVTVGNVTLDSYAACIDAIQQGGGGGASVDLLVVAGGGAGGYGYGTCAGGGGGAGGVIVRKGYGLSNCVYQVIVGEGGCHNNSYDNGSGGDSVFGELHTYGGGGGGRSLSTDGCFGMIKGIPGGSGGGAGTYLCKQIDASKGVSFPNELSWQGNSGGGAVCCTSYFTNASGGGGAGGEGASIICTTCCGTGGLGISSDIDGALKGYAGGGGGGKRINTTATNPGMCGGGNGGSYCCYGAYSNATTCGSGGGGSYCCRTPGIGGNGVVIVRYKTDSGLDATGGCKYTCGDYTIHCFMQDGYFKIGTPSGRCLSYLVVGGGGTGCIGGGGGGEVKFGTIDAESNSYNIVVGAGGVHSGVCDGGDSCFGSIVAHGGCAANGGLGGTSGSGCPGAGDSWLVSLGGSYGGLGMLGYGGGGGGGACYKYSAQYCSHICGGGAGLFTGGSNNTKPTNCGGGGGGARCGSSNACSNGACGVVDICYPSDGSYGFTTATGGDCCYVCGDMCVHRFTSNGTFTIVS